MNMGLQREIPRPAGESAGHRDDATHSFLMATKDFFRMTASIGDDVLLTHYGLAIRRAKTVAISSWKTSSKRGSTVRILASGISEPSRTTPDSFR